MILNHCSMEEYFIFFPSVYKYSGSIFISQLRMNTHETHCIVFIILRDFESRKIAIYVIDQAFTPLGASCNRYYGNMAISDEINRKTCTRNGKIETG